MDVVNRVTRSRMMAGIRGRNTKPEMMVRSLLHRAGLRFRLQAKGLPGRPDIVMRSRRVAIFVHGCFWHRHRGCRFAAVPKTRASFWARKLDANVTRDKRSIEILIQDGWRVLVVWECSVPRGLEDGLALQEALTRWVFSPLQYAEL